MNVEPGLFHVRNVTTSPNDTVVQSTFAVGNALVRYIVLSSYVEDQLSTGHRR